MQIFDPYATVAVPFPFTDRNSSKHRPAVVFSLRSFQKETGTCTCAMITSVPSAWPGDVPITDQNAAGLRVPSKIRLKSFTLDLDLIVRPRGTLAAVDKEGLKQALVTHCALETQS
ncbi:type II toxin-antitoxin system PemK/MazF family toxin [Candidatus Parcubacteria bacterium]|nr:MAG: type II toxin-antitoxin system PemK/MazF family toxin [Candidatus Parcubacteria bacterium]